MPTLVRPGTDTDLIGPSPATPAELKEPDLDADPEIPLVVTSGTVPAVAGGVGPDRAGGHRPVVAAAGCRPYYLWVTAGQGRTTTPRTVPDHVWVQAR